MRYVLHKLPYANKQPDAIGAIDPLLVGRAHVVYERGWSVEADGALEPVGSWEGVPETVAGLAAS